MPLSSQANSMEEGELEIAIDQAIAACDGNLRATIRALIVANNFLEIRDRRADESRLARLCPRTVSQLFRLTGIGRGEEADRRLPPSQFAIDAIVTPAPACQIAEEEPAQG